MLMTQEQETAYLQKNENAVWKIAHTLEGGLRYGVDLTDLYQEGMYALIVHLRAANTDAELGKFPSLSIRNAMVRYLLAQEVVKIPVRTGKRYRHAGQARRVHLDAVTGESAAEPEPAWIENLDMNAWLAKLPERHRKCIVLRGQGYSISEIAEMLGVTKGAVSHAIHRDVERYLREKKGA